MLRRWFGLILLPFVSFSADGLLAIVTFIRKQFFNHKHLDSHNMAEYRPIELSIQFLMFWIPLLVILGWFLRKPATLLYDPFEVSVLVAACFLVNYVTADNKTNWAEGVMLVAMYTMIVCVYPLVVILSHPLTCR
jgi:Ca2+:H+ antiporter